MDSQQQAPKRGIVKSILIWIRNYFTLIGVLATFLPILLVANLARMQKQMADDGKGTQLSESAPSRLTLELAGKVAEREPEFTELILQRFMGESRPIYLPEVRNALRRAANDKRIARLELDLGQIEGSAAEFTELRRIVLEFKAKGKPVHAILSDARDWNYYLASAATDIVLNPASPVEIMGPTFHLVYFGEAVRKLGFDLDVVRAGKYKAAFEPFVKDEPSEATLEQYGAMNASLIEHVVAAVAEGRKKSPEEVRGWYKKSIHTADEAVELGLVDKIGYGVGDLLEPRVTKDEAPVTVPEYAGLTKSEKDDRESVTDQGGIALIEATGEINMVAAPNGGEGIAPSPMRKRVRWALEDEDVKAVVLRISSPGGSAIASDMIWHDLRLLADAKPLVVSMGAVAASGGYYIAMPAKKIFAEPTTITGSIGVIGMMPSLKPFKEKYGVSFYVVTASDRKEMLSMGSKATPEDKALVEHSIDQVYHTFLQRVADGRKMEVPHVHDLAQGRVYTGGEALKLGLVDELGGLQAALNAAKELAGFDVNKLYPLMRYEGDKLDLSECLGSPSKMMKCFGQSAAVSRVEELQDTAAHVQRWLGLAERERALALWPGALGVKL